MNDDVERLVGHTAQAKSAVEAFGDVVDVDFVVLGHVVADEDVFDLEAPAVEDLAPGVEGLAFGMVSVKEN